MSRQKFVMKSKHFMTSKRCHDIKQISIVFHWRLPTRTLLTSVEWESRADTDVQRIVKPALERDLPVYTMDEPACVPADRVVAAVTAPPAEMGDLEALLRRLLPTAPVPTPPPRPIPTDIDILLERLLSGVPAPTPPPQTGITVLETLLQRLLPGTPVPAAETGLRCVFFLWQTGP